MLTTRLLTVLDRDDAARLDAFVAASPFGAYQQTAAWADAAPRRRQRGWLYFVAEDGGRMIGSAVVRTTRLALGYRLATIQRGPVVHDTRDLARVVDALGTALAKAGCCSVQMAPRVRGRALPDMAEALRAAGYAPLPARRQALHATTGIVWLDKPEEAVLAGFKQRARRALRAAERAGIRVRAVKSAADVATYQSVLDRFAAARPDYDMGGQPDAAGQARLIARLGGGMLLAERDGRTIGAHAFVRQADEAIWLSLATDADAGGASPGYPLLWEAMRAARADGAVGFDLAGMAATPPAEPGAAGRHQFKAAFAPHHRVLLPMQIAALSPLPHGVLMGMRDAWRDWRGWRARQAPVAAHG